MKSWFVDYVPWVSLEAPLSFVWNTVLGMPECPEASKSIVFSTRCKTTTKKFLYPVKTIDGNRKLEVPLSPKLQSASQNFTVRSRG